MLQLDFISSIDIMQRKRLVNGYRKSTPMEDENIYEVEKIIDKR